MSQSQSEDRSVDQGCEGKKPSKLMSGTMGEQRGIPASLRQPLFERLGEIIRDADAPHREVLSAVSAILAVSKINMANIALTMNVQQHEELEDA